MNRLSRYLVVAAVGACLAPTLALAAKDATVGEPRAAVKAQPLYINGKWSRSRSKVTRAIVNPSNDRVIGHIAEAGKVDVDRAVGAAQAAFPAWRGKLPAERADALLEIEKRINANRVEIAKMVTKETGKPYAEAYDEVGGTAAAFGYYANLVKGQAGEVAAPMAKNQINYSVREPYGVVAAVVPFNFPLLLTSWKVAPALAAGNTVVIKPPHQNPLSNLLMAKLFSGLPKGVVNVVTGAGEAGKLLASHPDVKVVAFTGSSKVGAMISQEAGKDLKKVHLELGGLDGSVVFADADLDKAAKELAWARGANAGQVCTSPKRIIVDASVADAFTAKLIEHVKAIRVGDPMDPTTDMGPMVTKDAREKIEKQLADTIKEGGKLLYQAKAPAGRKGQFFQPAVIQIEDGMLPTREEMFGPVYTIIVAKNEDDAIRVANKTPYALGASAFTTSQRLVHRARTELIGGTVWINQLQDNPMSLPFGGPYQSGDGRELGREGLNSFSWAKTVVESTGANRGDGYPYAARKIPGARRRSAQLDTSKE